MCLQQTDADRSLSPQCKHLSCTGVIIACWKCAEAERFFDASCRLKTYQQSNMMHCMMSTCWETAGTDGEPPPSAHYIEISHKYNTDHDRRVRVSGLHLTAGGGGGKQLHFKMLTIIIKTRLPTFEHAARASISSLTVCLPHKYKCVYINISVTGSANTRCQCTNTSRGTCTRLLITHLDGRKVQNFYT